MVTETHAIAARMHSFFVVASMAPDQRAALVDLYIATNGNTWIDKTGWRDHVSGSDPCDDAWFGVECEGRPGSDDVPV
jgi:hypothetical protein